MKTCTKCGIEKDLSEFHLEKRRNGFRSFCKACSSIIARRWRERNKDKERIVARLWYENNKEKKLKRCALWQKENKERKQVTNRLWTEANHEKCLEKCRRYRKNNLEKCREMARIHQLEIRRTLHGKINDSLSSGIRRSLKNNKNGYKWETLVGYSWKELKTHLEKRFKDGMNWERFMAGDIHVDHITPLCAFNFSSFTDIDFKRAWALDNLQPLWKEDNLTKHGKIDKPFQPALAMVV